MNRLGKILLAIGLLLGGAGCFPLQETSRTVSSESPAQTAAPVPPAVPHTRSSKKAITGSSLTESLGGILSSDNWTVYQEKEQEEFTRNVSYDNGIYRFKADYALSERKLNRITAKGSVFLRKQEADGSWYQVQADTVVYNYQTGQGYAVAATGKRINLQYYTAQEELWVARARRADFNTKQQTCQLTGNIWLTRTDVNKQVTTLKANRMTARQQGMYALLQGNAEVSNNQYRLQAQTIEYDGQENWAYAYGKRPLAQGAMEEGTFAIIADKVIAQTNTRQIQLQGQVQGWVVSDTINQSDPSQKK